MLRRLLLAGLLAVVTIAVPSGPLEPWGTEAGFAAETTASGAAVPVLQAGRRRRVQLARVRFAAGRRQAVRAWPSPMPAEDGARRWHRGPLTRRGPPIAAI